MQRLHPETDNIAMAHGDPLGNATASLTRAAAALEHTAQAMSKASEAFYSISHAVQGTGGENGSAQQPIVHPPPTLREYVPPHKRPQFLKKGLSFHLLVNLEADILPLVCALSQRYHKVICYMDCGITSLSMYRQILNDVTGKEIYMPNATDSDELDTLDTEFYWGGKAILLLPETLCSSNVFVAGESSCVIHVGWPFDQTQYKNQTLTHRAQDNVLIALSKDKNLYTLSSQLTTQTKGWSQKEAALRSLAVTVAPQTERSLVDISSITKEKVYSEWIRSRGPCGRRPVHSWSPTELVQRANSYLLDGLHYSTQGGGIGSLPQVTADFVMHNHLESAVRDGALNVEQTNPGLNHMSRLPQDTALWNTTAYTKSDYKPLPIGLHSRSVAMVNTEPSRIFSGEGFSPDANNLAEGRTIFENKGLQSTVQETPKRPAFETVPGLTYFALEEEFDAIPLMSFIAETHGKTIFFLEEPESLVHYRELFGYIISHTVIAPNVSMHRTQAIEGAVQEFASQQSPAVLLLPRSLQDLPETLKNISIDYTVYWGFNLPFEQPENHCTRLASFSTSMIGTVAQRDNLTDRNIMTLSEHPSMPLLRLQGDGELLAPTRKRAHLAVSMKNTAVKKLYISAICFFARPARRLVSAEEAVQRANEYAAKVLLRGSLEDGSAVFKPVGERPFVSPNIVKRFLLQPAVEAGLLTI
ncbi:hypothetical protein BDV93DRAFT_527828 [Ceratobasidium sp. AG-I]|nr:hypothetical protein BDV93DRAFT_527828 [Ceratobasidium sp. AG-I]